VNQDEINLCWQCTHHIANISGANERQLQGLVRLQDRKFDYLPESLRDQQWFTKVDKDGDVVLSFIGECHQNDAGCTHGRRVNVYVDHHAVITVRDLDEETSALLGVKKTAYIGNVEVMTPRGQTGS
jgi:hypothetical protein